LYFYSNQLVDITIGFMQILDVSATQTNIMITKGDNVTIAVPIVFNNKTTAGYSLQYLGGWDATGNAPQLLDNGLDADGNAKYSAGQFYVVSTAGNTALNGVTTWALNDWVLFTGSVWGKITDVYDITGSTVRFTVQDSAGTAILSKVTTTHVFPLAGVSEFTFTDADWLNFTDLSGDYPFDLELQISSGAKSTIVSGRFKVQKQFS